MLQCIHTTIETKGCELLLNHNDWLQVTHNEHINFFIRGIEQNNIKYIQTKQETTDGALIGQIKEYPFAYVELLNIGISILESKYGEDWSIKTT